jgi:RNA polymerase-interacting CarD/CdnL/TRCF family regulator
MDADLITLELARLVETGTDWSRRFRRYDQLIDAGLSCEEAARIVSDLPLTEQSKRAA